MSFNYGEFATIRNQAGLNSFNIGVQEFAQRTNAVSIISKAGRYGGTYAHKDIAFEFAMWISAEFKIYIVKEFQRLKAKEQELIGWSAKRELAKINYRIHTDAIQQNLIPAAVSRAQMNIIYASEADGAKAAGNEVEKEFACRPARIPRLLRGQRRMRNGLKPRRFTKKALSTAPSSLARQRRSGRA